MHNTKRGFRSVVFDVFGTTVYLPDLEHARATGQSAINASEKVEIDLLAHYRNAIEENRNRLLDNVKEFESALAIINK